MAHPWATMLLMSRINVSPAMMRYVDATLGCLRESGFSFPTADYAWNAIDSYIYGYTLQQLNFPFEPDEYAAAAAAFVPELDADAYPYLVGLSAEVIARPKSPVRGYYAARLAVWRAAGAPAPLPTPVDAWVDLAVWRDQVARATDPDVVWAAWRVLELSRWLAQETN